MTSRLTVPCCYQGGKQRIAPSIVRHLLNNSRVDENTKFLDLCCGSGAITLELINQGVSPSRITMLDISSWGKFWDAVGTGRFSSAHFKSYIDSIPDDRYHIHDHMVALSKSRADIDEEYKYLLLQASSFGGKQIWREGRIWKNAFFRAYWQPTEISIRRSPANPMQPQPQQLYERVKKIADLCKGVSCIHGDISQILGLSNSSNTIIYIDPPYSDTTGYGFSFNLPDVVSALRESNVIEVYVSEKIPVSQRAVKISFGGPKGGISGNKACKHEEWLSACV